MPLGPNSLAEAPLVLREAASRTSYCFDGEKRRGPSQLGHAIASSSPSPRVFALCRTLALGSAAVPALCPLLFTTVLFICTVFGAF